MKELAILTPAQIALKRAEALRCAALHAIALIRQATTEIDRYRSRGGACNLIGISKLSGILMISIAFLSACGKGSNTAPSTNSAPSNLTYSANPANYIYGNAIAPDQVTSSSPVKSFSVSPTLPVGLSFNTTTGTISGTPTTITASAAYTITATNAYGSNFTILNLAIVDNPPTITYGGTTTLTYVVGSGISAIAPTLGGGTTLSCAASPALPPGLALSSSCVLSGTPSAPETARTYTIAAENSGGTASLTFNFTVNDLVPVINYSGSPFTYHRGFAISQASVTNTGGAIVSCSSSPSLPAGLSLSNGCQISGTPSALSSGNYTITATNSGGSATTSIAISVTDLAPVISYSPNSYNLTKNANTTISATNSGGSITTCSSSPSLPSGLSLSNTGCQITGSYNGILSATSYTITATNSAGSSSTGVTLTVNDAAPTINYAGSPYTFYDLTTISSVTPSNSGGTITGCSSSPSLPAGLAISSTCVISGHPTTASAAANYTVTATNTGGNSAQTINIVVKEIAPAISYSGTPFTFNRSVPITPANATNTGGPITSCSVLPALPSGLSLTSACTLTGTPTVAIAAASYTVTATNSAGSGSVSISITVTDAPPVFNYPGNPYSFYLNQSITTIAPTSTGGTITSCTPATLANGLSVTSTCGITGTPTTLGGPTSYTITGTNLGGSSTATFTATVIDHAPIIAYSGSPYLVPQNAAFSQTPTNTGGTIVSCTSSPTLPGALTLSSACVIGGTATVISPATNYTITATNTGGNATAVINLAVSAIPNLTYSGSPYSFTAGTSVGTITPSNSGATTTSCSSSPTLPPGLSLSNTGVITGTPTAASTATSYTITASNSSGSSNVAVSITVLQAPALSFSPSSYTFTNAQAITPIVPGNSGSPATSCVSSPSLPTGLALSSSCTISGAATALGTGTYSITGTNSVGSGSANVTITVKDVAPAISYAGSPFLFTQNAAVSQSVTNTGGTPVSCTISPALPGAITLSSTCNLSGTATVLSSAANYTVTATNTGGTSTVVINLAVSAIPALTYSGSPYSFVINTSTGTLTPTNAGAPATSCSSSPTLPAGLSLSNDCVMSGTPTVMSAATTYTITATNGSGSANVAISITVTGAPVLSFNPSTYTLAINSAMSPVTPGNTGSTPASCSSSPTLPSPLALSSSCVISGTPNAISSATYVITGTNSAGSSSASVTLTVNDVAPTISYASPTYVTVLRTSTSIPSTTSGGTITSCAASPTLPAGLSFSATCGISGTPTVKSAATNYTVTATNTGGNGTASFSLQVKNQPLIAYYSLSALSGSANGTATGSNNAWTVTMDGVNKTALTSNTNASLDTIYPSFISTGGSVVFSSLTALSGSTNGTTSNSYDIWTESAAGGSLFSDTDNSNTGLSSDYPPSYSPDGTKIVFASKTAISGLANGTATSSYNIWIMDAAGNSKTALTQNTNANLNSINPVFSPDGTMVYFQSKTATAGTWNGTASNSYNIWKVAITGGTITHLTANTTTGLDSTEPHVSPDSGTVVFTSLAKIGATTPLSTNIWSVSSAGTGLAAITSNTAANLNSKNPSYSPDGSEITYASQVGVPGASSSYNIWKMKYDGSNQTYLTTNTASGLDSIAPSYSPDNLHIAFQSKMKISGTTSSSNNIWVMNQDGTSQTDLTSNTNSGLDSLLGTTNVWYQQ